MLDALTGIFPVRSTNPAADACVLQA
jgi:hypothetical protein